jgi:hypothetical protein
MSTVLDALDDAVAAAESAGQYFGKLEVSGQFVILRKGERKRVWLEGESTDGRVSEVTLRLNPHDITGLTKMVERQCLANDGEWTRIVWPSLRDLGFKSLRDINGQWGHVALVKSGETYVAKKGARMGETIEKTTFKFLGVWELESDLIKAWEAVNGSQPASNGTTPAPTVSQSNDAEKAAAMGFLPHIVAANKNDLTKLSEVLASMSPINKYFTVNSPEVQQLLAA